MNGNKKNTGIDWIDPDETSDLSAQEWAQKFEIAPVKRGRPVSATKKQSTTIRLDADILQHFKALGAGWQSRINASLRKVIEANKNGPEKNTRKRA